LADVSIGSALQVWGKVINWFEDRKVKSTRILLNTWSLMQQLGIVPAVPEAGVISNAA
jgi:hypothetical protein